MLSIIINIYNHPLNRSNRLRAIARFFKWQLFSRFYNFPILLPLTESSVYLCKNGLTGLTGNLYCGLLETEEMSFVLHYIRDEDCFFDVGANVGVYTILASQHSNCPVFSFEPHPSTFELLKLNMKVQLSSNNVFLHNIGLGAECGSMFLSSNLDTMNFVSPIETGNVLEVNIKTIDSLGLPVPSILKIDVEGFEYNVLQGSETIFSSNRLNVIIIELNGSGVRYGHLDTEIDNFLKGKGFYPHTYNPFERKIIKLDSYGKHNTIYIRNFDFAQDRVQTGKSVKLSNGVVL